jgi:peptide/nickel transport system substrate-binding protein
MKQHELFTQIKNTGDVNKQVDLMKQIIQIAADNFINMGIAVSTVQPYGIVKNNFKNVPPEFATSWNYVTLINTNPEQFYMDPAN